jgi:hypothetical protein
MTRPSATCELFVGGVRVADKGTDLSAGTATALSSLKLDWGRDGQNEQPGPASCSFEILDPVGGDSALDYLHVGSTVAVWAQGEVPGEAVEWGPSTYEDQQATWTGVPDGLPPPLSVGGIDIVNDPPFNPTWGRIASETLAVWAGSAGWGGPKIPPRPFSPTGQLPDAWDDIPKASVGDKWRYAVSVKAPPGTRYQVRIAPHFKPYGSSSGSWSVSSSPPIVTGNGDWQRTDWTMTILWLSEPAWLLVEIMINGQTGLGLHWKDQTITWAAATKAWNEYSADDKVYVDNAAVYPPGSGTTRRVLSFSGQISDMAFEPYGDGETVLIKALAMDVGAELANKIVGDAPWPVQALSTRADRIAQLAGVTSSPRVRVDAALSGLQVSYRDVDAQGAYPLLQDLAQTGGGVLWAATHAVTGPFLWIEDPPSRTALSTFALSGGQIVIMVSGRDVTNVSACDLLEDGAAWRQDSADVITVVAVTWLEQGVDDSGQPETTERTVTVTDSAAVATFGTRRLSVSTELISQADAQAMANRLIAQARAVKWRIDGITLDTATVPETNGSISDQEREMGLLNMLDGTIRMGLALLLVDMPAYAPLGGVSAYYVEGGTYEFTDGFWSLALTATPSGSQGKSAAWADIQTEQPTWRWDQWAPTIEWQDAFGVVVA